ncbi:MAG: amino acid ABC transporter substrate-binding protein [Alphaproteobacteria bacterium]|nr:amino acid ABC transporter substrate-binding protein [Alphaproteobacteria bacterium]
MIRPRMMIAVLSTLLTLAGQASAGDSTLDAVRARGVVRCGVTELGQLLSTMDLDGRWVGFYSDFCRAVAAATTGRAENVEFVLTSVSERFDLVRRGAIDLLSEASTWTMSRDGDGLAFPGIYFMDGQAALVRRDTGFKSLADMKGRTVCVQDASTSIENLRDADAAQKLGLDIRPFATIEGAYEAFFARRCEALSTDAIILASMREFLAPNPAEYVLLPDRISKEPISPVVRENDSRWEDAVRWTLFALISAEELGVTSANAESMRATGSQEAKRLLGAVPGLGKRLGLDDAWAFRVIAQVGNYGEVFERSLGAKSAFKMQRGMNDLASRGGALWAPPVR